MTPATDCSIEDCVRATLRRGLCAVHHDHQAYLLRRNGLNWNDWEGGEQDNFNHETFVQGVPSYDIPLDYLPPEGEGDLL